ncbi:MAG TPA: hypothetical protein VJR71_00870 [Pseudolabrys sp.]|nr:hypothetical protein [Pseudolabrys sp.]
MPAKGQDNLMEKSHIIARLVGPVLCAIGVGMLSNQAAYREMAGQFFGTLPFIYFSGILALVAGLYILNVHNVWARDWRSVVTIVGWVLMCVGAFRIIAPQFATFVATAIIASAGFFTGLGIFLVAVGGFITFKGYAA